MLDAAKSGLSKYRLERAGEMLKTARRDLDAGDYASANNRAYYCIFHAMRATLALTGEDYKKAFRRDFPLLRAVSENQGSPTGIEQNHLHGLHHPQSQRL